MSSSNRAPAIIIGLVLILLAAMAILGKQTPSIVEDPVWTIIQPPKDVMTMVDGGDIIWVGGKNGVIGIDEETHDLVEFPCEQRLTYTRTLLWEDGVLWIGHDRGLTRWTTEGWHTYTVEDGLVTDRVNCVFRDRDGVLWVGTWHGAHYDTGSGWDKITTEDGLLSNYVNTITQHSNGDIWFGSYTTPNGGITILSGGEWQYFSTENGLIHNNIVQFMEDTDGSMWACTGLLTIGAGVQFEHHDGGWVLSGMLTSEDGIPEGKVRSIFRDSDDVLWVGTEDNGVALMDDTGIRVISVEDGLSNNEVKDYLEDRYGNLWLATRDGITILTQEDIMNIS